MTVFIAFCKKKKIALQRGRKKTQTEKELVWTLDLPISFSAVFYNLQRNKFLPMRHLNSFWFVLPLGLTRSNAYRLCWLPCFSLGNSRWKVSGPEGLSFLVMKRQVRSFKLAQRRISCLFSPTAPEEGMWSRVWAPCPRAMPNPGGCYPLREGWSGFMPRSISFPYSSGGAESIQKSPEMPGKVQLSSFCVTECPRRT